MANVDIMPILPDDYDPLRVKRMEEQAYAAAKARVAADAGVPFPSDIINAAKQLNMPPSNLALLFAKSKDPEAYESYVNARLYEAFVKSDPPSITSWDSMHDINTPFGPLSKLYEPLVKDFAAALGIELNDSLQIVGGDWDILKGANPPIDLSNPDSPHNPFVGAFNAFVSNIKFPKDLPPEEALSFFLTQAHSQLSQKVSIRSNREFVDPSASNKDAFKNNLSYESIYYQFASDPSEEGFQSSLEDFYQLEVQSKGSFLPGPSFADYTKFSVSGPQYKVSGLETSGLDDTILVNQIPKPDISVLNDLIMLLIALLETHQRVAMAQAEKMQFYTEYQNVYTQLQMQVPIFLKGDPGYIGGTKTDAGQLRNDLNSNYNAILIDEMRTLRGVQEDYAKKMQTNLNTSNQAKSQVEELITTLLQQTNSLVSAILNK